MKEKERVNKTGSEKREVSQAAKAIMEKVLAAKRASVLPVAAQATALEDTVTSEPTSRPSSKSPPGVFDDLAAVQSTSRSSSARIPSTGRTSSPAVVAKNQVTCPVCQSSPFHLRYRCPVVTAGPDAITKRIAELREDDTDRSAIIEELEVMVAKSRDKAKLAMDKNNVNSHSTPRPSAAAEADQQIISYASDVVPDTGAAQPQVLGNNSHSSDVPKGSKQQEGSSSSDDSDSDSSNEPNQIFANVFNASTHDGIDLTAVLHGPSKSRLSIDQILSGIESDEESDSDKEEEEVLLDEDEDDAKFRRQSRKVDDAGSSDEDGVDDEDADTDDHATLFPIGVPDSNPSRASTHNPETSFTAMNGQAESVEVDFTGDGAASDAMESDTAIFRLLKTPDSNAVVGLPEESGPAAASPSIIPSHEKPQENVEAAVATNDMITSITDNTSGGGIGIPPVKEAVPRLESTRNRALDSSPCDDDDDDPIESAEDFQRNDSPIEPGEPNLIINTLTQSSAPAGLVRRMKGRDGRDVSATPVIPVRLRLRSSQNTPTVSTSDVPEDTIARRTRTATRSLSQAKTPPASTNGAPAPVKRRRGPNKTAAQKAEEAALKEEKARLREEKALAKASQKPSAKPKVIEEVIPASDEDEELEYPKTPKLPAASLSVPTSLNTWETLKLSSPSNDAESPSMRDELLSSSFGASKHPSQRSPTTVNEPLFLLTESQPPFPFSQWDNSIPPGSANDSEDEQEVEASIKSSRPTQGTASSYRRLTDIASQRLLFSTPPVFQPARFPSSKGKLDDLYGTTREDEDEDEDDSSSDEEANDSHIPQLRRAGKLGKS